MLNILSNSNVNCFKIFAKAHLFNIGILHLNLNFECLNLGLNNICNFFFSRYLHIKYFEIEVLQF